MSYANNQGIRIHYETVGQGPPLILQYGQYFPLEIWHEYHYVTALQDHFQLILVDARGHGDSDKPYDPQAYAMDRLVKDILAVMDALDLEKAHYMGYSSGAYLGFAMASHALERVHSLILGGSYPYADPEGAERFTNEQIQNLEKQTSPQFVDGLEEFILSQNFPPFSPRLRAGLLKHDLRALIAWLRSRLDYPGYDNVVHTIDVPCLLYAGDESGEYQKAQQAAGQIRTASFVGIPGGGHLEGGTWIDLLKPHILGVTA